MTRQTTRGLVIVYLFRAKFFCGLQLTAKTAKVVAKMRTERDREDTWGSPSNADLQARSQGRFEGVRANLLIA